MYGSIRVNIRDKLAFSAYHQWLILYEAIFLSGVSMTWDLSKVSFRQVGWITVTGNAGTTFASAREAHDPQPELIKKSVDWSRFIPFYPMLLCFFLLKGDFTFDTTIITQAWELRVNIYAWLLFHEDGMLNCWQCKMAEASKTHYAIVREVQTFLQFEKSAENHNPREKSLRGFDSCPWNLICLIWFVQFFKRFKVSIMIFFQMDGRFRGSQPGQASEVCRYQLRSHQDSGSWRGSAGNGRWDRWAGKMKDEVFHGVSM